ncbi:cupin domain-containing protein [Williamsia sterculiae]|uniref:DUF985 domain-containing protein n=1 Tax=Williamsia sterculiae TaxID=1344003 RepID=A0A1N7G367_9NOCA|nr:cupin domain-containing protein [Williamsia sterculiae]SIS06985.1 hypothetical protein SAMN05445060_2443 [Williamsia sterculiae]
MTELPDWAVELDLNPHPEGGWYRQTWASELELPEHVLPLGYSGARAGATAVLFLLLPGEESAWHRVRSAEIWLHHRGSALELGRGGLGEGPEPAGVEILGPAVERGQRPQAIIAPGEWQSARPIDDEPALVSCIVVPGFDFDDFSLA